MLNLYTSQYGGDVTDADKESGMKPLIPGKIKNEIKRAYRANLSGTSLIQDKNATPAEPESNVTATEKVLRPISLVAQKSGKSASMAHEEHGNVLASFQTLEVQTGSTMVNQHRPEYLGFANPFTMPVAVGGYDFPGQDGSRWRRPTAEDAKLHMKTDWFRGQLQSAAAEVKLFDITRGMPRRIEGQYIRHWAFVPSLWNLYFREQVNTGLSLSAQSQVHAAEPQEAVE